MNPPATSPVSEPLIRRQSPRLMWPFIGALTFLGGLAAVLVASKEARELAEDSLKTIFGVVTTPFIFESTCALLFIAGLISYNRWRIQKEGDGWVYIVETEAETELPKSLTERLHNTVLSNKPEALDEEQARRSTIEGFLELGMGAQALSEFEPVKSWPDDIDTADLHIRVLAANADQDAAAKLLRSSVERYSGSVTRFSGVALDIARWTLAHQQQPAVTEFWITEARKLTPYSRFHVAESDPLHPFLKS